MQIGETFATTIHERIEPVVKVDDRRPSVLLKELRNLVVTPQWEQHLNHILEEFTDALDREEEQGVGIWISGFFGSGKSLLMKVLGVLLEDGEIQGQSVHQTFLNRVPSSSTERKNLERFLAICTRKLSISFIGGNLHGQQGATDDSLSLIVFRLFARAREYTHIPAFAWAVEYPLDIRGLTAEFRSVASEKCGKMWEEITQEAIFHTDQLYEAAVAVLPNHFQGVESVERTVANAQRSGITADMLIERLKHWCTTHDSVGRRHKLLLQLDELGQWIKSGNAHDRTTQMQAFVEKASTHGQGRIWIAVTAHGDVQALRDNVDQAQFAKINQRFSLKCKLSNDDISQVVEERLLSKRQQARQELDRRFAERSGDITDLGTVQRISRIYPVPTRENFALFYPYFPWTITVIPDVIKGIAQVTGRDEELTGSNRTMIGVVQGGIIETKGLLDAPIGRLLCLADLYDELAADAPIETRTDINRIRETVEAGNGADSYLITRVAKALYLLGQAKHIPCTLDNVSRSLVNSLATDLATLRSQVKSALERLVAAGYAKEINEEYSFLTTQQRSFQDKVRARQHDLAGHIYELSQQLIKEFGKEDPFRFDQVPLSGREKKLKLELDGRVIYNPAESVTVRIYSPFQRILDQEVADDIALKQRSQQEPNNIFFRAEDRKELRYALAQYLATEEIAEQTMKTTLPGDPEKEVAQQAKLSDVTSYKKQVLSSLAQAVRGGTVFFRGTLYQLMDGDNASSAVRNTLKELLPVIYTRFEEVPHRIASEENAVRAALSGNTTNSDLKALGVYKLDGTLNESNVLFVTLRAKLPQADADEGAINADQLRTLFEQPPYGWDGHCVKVGLALLLRASVCRLIEGGRTFTDPSNSEVVQLLTKEQRFKWLRVQGIRSDLTMAELQSIRDAIETIFGDKPVLVVATLHAKLGEFLEKTQRQAQEIQTWAITARCPLPTAFESGMSIIEEQLHSPVPAVRLALFLRQWQTLLDHTVLLQDLGEFKQAHGADYVTVREFFNTMVNADLNLSEVRSFINDWRAVTTERSVTNPKRWNEITTTYRNAQQAVMNYIASVQQEAKQNLHEMLATLPERIRNAGVQLEHLDEMLTTLSADIERLQVRVEQPIYDISEARNLRSAVTSIQLHLQKQLQEIRVRNQPSIPAQLQEIHLRWQDLLGQVRIGSTDDLEEMLQRARRRIVSELEQQKAIIIE